MIAGYSNGTPVLDGPTIFKLVDSNGLPLDLILDLLEHHQMAFDVLGFIKKAHTSKNYENRDRLRILFHSNMKSSKNSETIKVLIEKCLDQVYGAST